MNEYGAKTIILICKNCCVPSELTYDPGHKEIDEEHDILLCPHCGLNIFRLTDDRAVAMIEEAEQKYKELQQIEKENEVKENEGTII